MKNLWARLFVLVVSASLIASCNDDEDDSHAKNVVEFTASEASVMENSVEHLITLNFVRPAIGDGKIQVAVDVEQAKYFTSTPPLVNGVLSLDIEKNKTSVTFKVVPVNNLDRDDDKVILFTLKSLSEQFFPGVKNKLSLTIKDDEATSPGSYINFIPASAIVKENKTDGYEIQLNISSPESADGGVVIKSSSAKAIYGQHYITEPAFTNGELSLEITPGSSLLTFKVIPIDNGIVTGEVDVEFTIVRTLGNIKKGDQLKNAFKISDDELENKPKGYEVGGGNWGLKKTIEYDEIGRIHKVHVENATPEKSSHIETYFYNGAGQLEKINEYENIDEVFTWENNRIVKSEKIRYGVVKSYVMYDYDDFGNVSGTMTYHLQPDGNFLLTILVGYLYYTDGNLYKALTYTAAPNGGEPTLVTTRTYDGYIDAENPFPMVEILPTVKTQTKLPSTYRIEENGYDLLYNISYEFRTDGLLQKRTASGPQVNEIAVYHYY